MKDCALLTANKIIIFMTHAAEKEHPGPRAAEVEPQRHQEPPASATQRLVGQQRQQRRPVLEADHGRQVGKGSNHSVEQISLKEERMRESELRICCGVKA